jgi:hypothetical protein
VSSSPRWKQRPGFPLTARCSLKSQKLVKSYTSRSRSLFDEKSGRLLIC